MICASDASSPLELEEERVAEGGVIPAISMPRSSAAVLTLISTPSPPGSCVSCSSCGAVEVLLDEEDSGARGGLDSSAMQSRKDGRGRRDSRGPDADRLPRRRSWKKLS